MRIIEAAEVRMRTSMPALIDALRTAFRGEIHAPPRTVHHLSDSASLLLMPAWDDGHQIGVKLVQVDTARSSAVAASYLLFDGASGRLEAVIDGAMLTARRTAAASALAADYLARDDARTLAILGTGVLAPHFAEAHAAVRPIDSVLIWGRNPERAARVADDVRQAGIDALALPDAGEAVARADIVSCVTSATTPVLHGANLRPGTHVDLVGAFRTDMREADDAVFDDATVYVDTVAGALDEAGDLLHAIDAGVLAADDIRGDLADLCRDKAPGRTTKAEITVFKSVGTSIEDLACAELIVASRDHDEPD